jgi:NTE family protein
VNGSSQDGRWNTVAGQVIHEADGVFEGGGVKGVALVGALAGFAECGYTEWKSVAGTSAGAILAAYLAVGHSLEDAMNTIANAPYQTFEDWGRGGEVAGGALNLIRDHGLCHGEAFRQWMSAQLAGKRFRDVENPDGTTRLKMIATDITRGKMLVLPADLTDYIDAETGQPIVPRDFRIADAVRMSMSIPYFFEPVHLTAAADAQQCLIVDGGVLSNFPVWLFDADPGQAPTRPTFGFKITGGHGVGGGLERVVDHLGWPVEMALRMFQTATGAWDDRFASHSTVVRTCPVPAGTLGTTDFARVQTVKDHVVHDAKEAAVSFLHEKFDLSEYRNTYGRSIVT